jgi:hypothetical protein
MRKQLSALACALLVAALPGRAELLQVDLSIFGMDFLRAPPRVYRGALTRCITKGATDPKMLARVFAERSVGHV